MSENQIKQAEAYLSQVASMPQTEQASQLSHDIGCQSATQSELRNFIGGGASALRQHLDSTRGKLVWSSVMLIALLIVAAYTTAGYIEMRAENQRLVASMESQVPAEMPTRTYVENTNTDLGEQISWLGDVVNDMVTLVRPIPDSMLASLKVETVALEAKQDLLSLESSDSPRS